MFSHFPDLCLRISLITASLALVSCEQQTTSRQAVAGPGGLETPTAIQSDLRPGGTQRAVNVANPFEGDATAISEGRRLYNWYNCVGCHFNGGGGMGPPLMDDEWIYGPEPENIHDVILRGRPNGMPAFGGRIPEQQMWQIVAYVRTLNPDQPGDDGEQDEGEASRPEGSRRR